MGNVTADRAWDVHPVTEADIEAYLDIYLNAYPAYKALDGECRQHRQAELCLAQLDGLHQERHVPAPPTAASPAASAALPESACSTTW